MNPGRKQRVAALLAIARETFHWSFVPIVLYLGFKKGADPGVYRCVFE